MKRRRKRKRKKKSSSSSSISGHASAKEGSLFALMLAALTNHHHNPESTPILNQSLRRLSLSLLSKTPNPFLSLFPLLLHSKYAEVVTSSLEIMGAASLYSLEMNEQISLDDEIVKGLITVVGISEKKTVALAACNAVLDLSTTSIGRQRLLLFSALENLMFLNVQEQWFLYSPRKRAVPPVLE